jgi:hypothetical protein
MGNVLVIWALVALAGSPTQMEIKTIDYGNPRSCSRALGELKLGAGWNAACMSPAQFENFRKGK